MEDDAPPSEVKFTYRKGGSYRMIHVDGALGSIGPTGRYIHMTVWSERKSLPREQVFDVSPDGSLAKEAKAVTDIGGIFRQLEASLVLDIPTAKAVKAWLEKQLVKHEEMKKELEKAAKDHPSSTESGDDE